MRFQRKISRKKFVKLIFGNLFTTQINQKKGYKEHAEKGVIRKLPIRKLLGLPKDQVYNFFAPAITLNSLIEKHHIKNIDLLSLDVEGSEFDVLKNFLRTVCFKHYLQMKFSSESVNP